MKSIIHFTYLKTPQNYYLFFIESIKYLLEKCEIILPIIDNCKKELAKHLKKTYIEKYFSKISPTNKFPYL